MSLFSNEHASKIASAIAFFNSLSKERKAYVVANILNLSEEENDNLGQVSVHVVSKSHTPLLNFFDTPDLYASKIL